MPYLKKWQKENMYKLVEFKLSLAKEEVQEKKIKKEKIAAKCAENNRLVDACAEDVLKQARSWLCKTRMHKEERVLLLMRFLSSQDK
jgi:hypothetical protein